jgi:hypothetical protein
MSKKKYLGKFHGCQRWRPEEYHIVSDPKLTLFGYTKFNIGRFDENYDGIFVTEFYLIELHKDPDTEKEFYEIV